MAVLLINLIHKRHGTALVKFCKVILWKIDVNFVRALYKALQLFPSKLVSQLVEWTMSFPMILWFGMLSCF